MLRLADVVASYGPATVLHSLSLEVQSGEIVCLLGGNAAGKSTTLKTILGMVRPSAGSVQLDHERIDRLATEDIVRRGIALVPESPLLRRRFDLYRNATTDDAGKFRLKNIPPGTYKLFSWEYVESDAWQEAEFLQPYETTGKLLTVREGSTQETQVKVTPIKR
jgi:ABC-type sugar transport system ATPase subunit